MIILETERLFFRPHEEADLNAYCEMMADPEFRRLSGGKPLLREEAEKSLRSILLGQQDWLRPKPMGLFATIFKQEGRYIGRCGVYAHRDAENLVIPGEGTLGYYLARPYWGRGHRGRSRLHPVWVRRTRTHPPCRGS
jgi:ribosomal-protein-alanine N-acetyltransferase